MGFFNLFKRGEVTATTFCRAPLPPVRREIVLEQRMVQETKAQNTLLKGALNDLEKRIYNAAQVNRLTADWWVNVTSANSEIYVSRKAAISRSRELERDDAYMRRCLRLFENNIVGHLGIRLINKARVPGTIGGKSGDQLPGLDRRANYFVHKAWREWCRAKNCTVQKNMTMAQCQRMTVRALKRDGGILWRKRRGNMVGNKFRFALEAIEIDRLDHDLNRPALVDATEGYSNDPTTNQILFGKEVDSFGAAVAYHVLYRHPGEVFAWRPSPHYRERIPAGEIIEVMTLERAGQYIGMPETVAVVQLMNHLHRYVEAEVIAARIAACKGGFIKKNIPEGYTGNEDVAGNSVEEIQPGFMKELKIGQEFMPYDPQHPNANFGQFQKGMIRGIASGMNLSYHTVANDLEGISFSSIRSGTLEDREEYLTGQEDLAVQFCEPVFEDFLPFALMTENVADGEYTMADFERLNAHTWKGRRWDWVDPLRDVQASDLAIQKGITSRSRVTEDYNGEDVETIDQEQEEDRDSADKHGCTYTPPPVQFDSSGAPQSGEQETEKDKKQNLKFMQAVEWRCNTCGEKDYIREGDDAPGCCEFCSGEDIEIQLVRVTKQKTNGHRKLSHA